MLCAITPSFIRVTNWLASLSSPCYHKVEDAVLSDTFANWSRQFNRCLQKEKCALQFKADLVNITDLQPSGEDFRWYLKLKCNSCNEETAEFVYLTLLENQPLKGGRGHASLVVKCKLCGRENSIDIIKDTIKPYNAEDSSRFKTIVAFECRGVEPTEFSPRCGWIAKGEDSTAVFDDVDITEGEWADYDDKANEEVGIYEIQSKFARL